MAWMAGGAAARAIPADLLQHKTDRWSVVPIPDPTPDQMTDVEPGPDGAVYMTNSTQGIYRVTLTEKRPSAVPYHFISLPGYYPTYLRAGRRGSLYAELRTQDGKQFVGDLNWQTGALRLYSFNPSPQGDIFINTSMALGPDDKLWLCEQKHIASIGPRGVIREYSIPKIARVFNNDASVVLGPDRKIWFTLQGAVGISPYLANIDPKTHTITAHALPSGSCDETAGLAVGGDGALYVACSYFFGGEPLIARVTTRGAVSSIPYPNGFMWYVNSIVGGPDGNVYFSAAPHGALVVYDPIRKTFTLRQPPVGELRPVTVGPDGNIWGGVDTVGLEAYRL